MHKNANLWLMLEYQKELNNIELERIWQVKTTTLQKRFSDGNFDNKEYMKF